MSPSLFPVTEDLVALREHVLQLFVGDGSVADKLGPTPGVYSFPKIIKAFHI